MTNMPTKIDQFFNFSSCKSQELEEGEISDSNFNKQEILKLIENKNTHNQKNESLASKNLIQPNPSESASEEQSESDSELEEEVGFFHKLIKGAGDGNTVASENKFLQKKRQADRSEENSQVKLKNEEKGIQPFPKKEHKKNHKMHEVKKPKQICQYYIHGACKKGDECTYSHDAPQLEKSGLCKFFLTGNCNKGDSCLYSHDTSKFPCKFFHALGYCNLGEECKFSHKRLSEQEIYKFIEQNEEFIFSLYKTFGRTNMDDFINQYLAEKKKGSFKEFSERESVSLQTLMIPQSIMNIRMNPVNAPPQNTPPFLPNQLPSQLPLLHSGMQQTPNRPVMPPQMFQMLLKNPQMMHMIRNPIHNPVMPPTIFPQKSNEIIFNPTVERNLNVSNFLNQINPFEKPKIQDLKPVGDPPRNLNENKEHPKSIFEKISESSPSDSPKVVYGSEEDEESEEEMNFFHKSKTLQNDNSVNKEVHMSNPTKLTHSQVSNQTVPHQIPYQLLPSITHNPSKSSPPGKTIHNSTKNSTPKDPRKRKK